MISDLNLNHQVLIKLICINVLHKYTSRERHVEIAEN